jgi:hypothetical protein
MRPLSQQVFTDLRHFANNVLVIVSRLVIDMDETPFYFFSCLNFVLQFHPKVMTFLEKCLLRHDDFNFDKELGSETGRCNNNSK